MFGFHSHLDRRPKYRWDWCWRLWHRRYGRIVEVASARAIGLSYSIPNDDDDDKRPMLRVCLFIVQVFLSMPWRQSFPLDIYKHAEGCMANREWGFYLPFTSDLPDLFLYYGGPDCGRGEGTKLIEMPWSWGSNVRREILTEPETHPYLYRLDSGAVQHRNATIKAEEREWRRWWIPWRRVSRYIDVQFDGEVGERTGSWKGGTLGCGYEMKADERPVDTLRRMERERTFR